MLRQISKESIKLGNYLKERLPGEMLTFAQIERDTDVKMDTQGKRMLRSAAKREGIVYSAIRGEGVSLTNENTSMEKEFWHFKKTNRQLKRHKKDHDIMVGKFYEKMDDETKAGIMIVSSIFGQMRLMAEQGKKLFKKDAKEIKTIEVPIPKLK